MYSEFFKDDCSPRGNSKFSRLVNSSQNLSILFDAFYLTFFSLRPTNPCSQTLDVLERDFLYEANKLESSKKLYIRRSAKHSEHGDVAVKRYMEIVLEKVKKREEVNARKDDIEFQKSLILDELKSSMVAFDEFDMILNEDMLDMYRENAKKEMAQIEQESRELQKKLDEELRARESDEIVTTLTFLHYFKFDFFLTHKTKMLLTKLFEKIVCNHILF